jgi:phosphatidylserine/phosphatidylglycerophosphate/cardiolipin synthase-like enzyme
MPRKHLGKSVQFPWRLDNRFVLRLDGADFFPAMLGAIAQARQYLCLEMYLFESGRVADQFIDALSDAGRRGVKLYLLLDDFGALALNRKDRQRLYDAGARISFYNSLSYAGFHRNLFRNHRKLLLVDGRTAFVGGMGITDAFDARSFGVLAWHEVAVQIEGPILGDWQEAFLRTWNLWTPSPLALPDPAAAAAGKAPGRVALSAGIQRAEIKGALLRHVRAAERRVWIATAYFIPDRKLRRALRRAAGAGVDVRLLLAGPRTDHPAVRQAGRRFYTHLLRSGVRIFEYQPRFLHAKIQLCDDWASIGSSNLDRWNFRWNLEANQEVEDEDFARRTAALFEMDFSESVEVTYEEWSRRSWWTRWQEAFWGRVDIWMERLSQLRR